MHLSVLYSGCAISSAAKTLILDLVEVMVWPTWFTVFPPCRGHFLLSTENVLYKVDEAVCTCCKITGTKGNARELDHSAIEVLDFDHYALDNPLFRITSWPTYVL